ncbi:MAG: LysR family transcriptional regulator [Magnetococcales bacterium]|nr:LysR family transcriptional regulator [Magnetococcales bacterium]
MDRLQAMQTFIRVAEEGSFSAAARRLGISKALVSKQIGQLEESLQTRLLQRTTRQVQLTLEGAQHLESCRRILHDLQEAEEALAAMRREPSGLLRISAPISFAHRHLAPVLSDFLSMYPRIRIDLSVNDRHVDLIEEGFDMAVRIGQLADPSLIARRLAPIRLVLCAAPHYLQQHGQPSHVDQLRHHSCLVYALTRTVATQWQPFDPEYFANHPLNRLRVNNGDTIRIAALQGLGLAILPSFLIAEDLQAGHLIALLPEHPLPETALHAVYPQQKHLSLKVRACIDLLADRFKALF